MLMICPHGRTHFGRDAEIQAMDGNKSVVQMLDSGNMPTRSFMFSVAGTSVDAPSLPSLDAGFRHPCRNECAREGISSTWCKSMSREAINLVAKGNCVAREAGWGATRGERPVRRITNPIRRGVAASLLIYGEA